MNGTWTRHLPASVRKSLEGRVWLQKAVGNTGWLFADHVVRMGVGLVVGVWLARYLGPQEFGLFNYALAVVALASPLSALGIDDVAVRNLVRDPTAHEEILGTAFLLRVAGGAVSLLAVVAAVRALRPGEARSLWLVAVIAGGGLFQALDAVEYWFRSRLEAKYAVLVRSSAFVSCALLKILLILGGAPLIAFAWVGAAELALGSMGLALAYARRGYRLSAWRGSAKVARELLRDSWPLLLSNLVVTVYLRIDQVMLGEMLGSEAVGVYSVAVRLAEVWLFIPYAVYWSVLPSLVEAKAASDELFYARLQRYYNLMALCGYALAVPVALLAPLLVSTLFGPSFAGAGLILSILVWANLFTFLEIARSAFFNVMNWNRIYFATVALGALLNVGLNLHLIPRYGGVGAAVASCVAYWFAAHGACFLYKPLRKTGSMLTRALLRPRIG